MALQMSWQPNLHRRKSGPPLGLKNLGNTCYLNSVLQCLTYTPPLANFCLKNQHSTLCSSSSGTGDCPFCILERRIVRSLSIDVAQDAPSKISNSLRIFAEHFRFGQQEDAHEFLRYVIDACHNTCLKILKGRKAVYRHGTVMREIFGGALQSVVKCLSCGGESSKTDEMMDISLDLFQYNTLKEVLYRFFQPEVLDGSNKYKCEKCKKLSSAKKQMSILHAPNVLVIQLKRFEGIPGLKIDRAINFEEVLTLSSYMCSASQDPQPEYNLFGSIVHSGFSVDSGHYYAYIKDATGRWYRCNDHQVSLSTLQEVLSEKVYILFFSRSNQRPRPSKTASAFTEKKSSDYSGQNVLVNQKATAPLKKSLTRLHSTNHVEKANPTVSKVAKAPSSPQIKFNIKASASKRFNANGSGNLEVARAHNGVGKDKQFEEKVDLKKVNILTSKSTTVSAAGEKLDKPVTSNGKHDEGDKFAKLSGSESKLASSLSNGKRENCTIDDSKATEVAEDFITRSVGRAGGESGLDHTLQNGSSKYPGSPRLKRKSPGTVKSENRLATDRSNLQLLADTSEFVELKELLVKDANSCLRSCGWADKVYGHMKDRKRLCADSAGLLPGDDKLKKLLVADARKQFISQVPESLKAHLVQIIKHWRTNGYVNH